MGVPGWLLKLVIGFLTERKMTLRYKGTQAESKSLPGGGPQGTILGLFLFLILINDAGFEHLQKQVGDQITRGLNKRKSLGNIHLKFIDDMTMAEAMELKSKLILNPDPCPQLPLAYHERTGHVLPEGECQMTEQLRKLCEYSNQNQMVINGGKSKVMLFNTRKIYDFMPKLSIDETSYP